jgi:hypothetical protein
LIHIDQNVSHNQENKNDVVVLLMNLVFLPINGICESQAFVDQAVTGGHRPKNECKLNNIPVWAFYNGVKKWEL